MLDFSHPSHYAAPVPRPTPPPHEIVVPGALSLCPLRGDWRQLYFRYVPTSPRTDLPLLICVHGITRNAWEIATRFLPYCDQAGVTMIAPIFSKQAHRRYQLMQPSDGGHAADEILEQMVTEVHDLLALRSRQRCLFGYSGGAQFVHRFAFAYPERVKRYAIGAAGWYTWPDHALPYPYGLAASDHPGWRPMDATRLLRVPARVLVGERDVEDDAKLNQSRQIATLQGSTRLERAINWIEAMRHAAMKQSLSTELEIDVLPNAAHSFSRCGDNGLVSNVFQFLYGAGLQ